MSQPAASFLSDPAFVAELQQAAAVAGKTPEQAGKYAARCLREIEAAPRDSWLRPAARMARFIYTRSYEAELDINLDALEQLKTQYKDHLLLFLWSHKSHMDSFVFLLSLYENNFRPLPLIFAGINMNFVGFGALARRVGAVFLRRTFHEDPIYKLVFRRYIDSLIANGTALSWSIEGTRSRTGKLSPPKLGLLSWIIESCQREQRSDVLLVPVSIAFDRIAEIDDYVAIQSGQPKRKESLRWFVDYIFGMRQPYGKVYVRYAQPVPLQDYIAPGTDADKLPPTRLNQLAFEVCTRIEQITPIKSADVLLMVLLGANERALTAQEIYQQASEIASLVQRRALPAASGFRLESTEQVSAAIIALENAGLVNAYDKAPDTVYYIPQGKRLAAAYYRNTITHYFLNAALAEMGLALCTLDIDLPDEAALKKHVMALRDLYRFEFFYRPPQEFWQGVMFEVSERYSGWDDSNQSLAKLLRDKPPRFSHAILRSITEAYLVIAVALLDLEDRPVENTKALLQQLLAQGEQMRLRQTVSCESSVSQDLFSNGLRLADHLGLLTGNPRQLVAARKQFADQVVAALSALNSLQRAYNAAWFSSLSAGRVSGLIGP
tara:strand:+ start:79603 stop:81423 length:1821 start_codon:yes stop_codon:yes gene_type:complete